MLFSWVPLYCTGSCVSTTKDTDTTHAVQTAAYLSVSFSACVLFKLCSFYGFHFTVQALVSAPPLTDTTQFKQLPITSISTILCSFVASLKLCSFYRFHFTVFLCQHNHQHYTLFICLSVSFSARLLLP